MNTLRHILLLFWMDKMVYAFGNHSRYVNYEHALRQHLFDPEFYNPMVRPRLNNSDPVTVQFGWKLIALQDISDRDESMTVSGTVIMWWYDELLRWRQHKFGGLKNIVVMGSEIWTPKLVVRNRLNDGYLEEGLDRKLLNVNSDGKVSIEYTDKFYVACNINPYRFPFDCQVCHVILNVMTYSRAQIDVIEKKKNLKPNEDVYGVWKIRKIEVHTRNREIDKPVGIFITFFLQRESSYYIVMLVIPSIILSSLSLATFFIPDDEGEKISSSMTIFLSFVVFLIRLEELLPQSSSSFPAIGIYFILLMSSSVIMTLNTILSSYITFRQKYASEHEADIPRDKPLKTKDRKMSVGRDEITCETENTTQQNVFEWKRFPSYCVFIVCIVLVIIANFIIFSVALHQDCANEIPMNPPPTAKTSPSSKVTMI